MENIKIKVDGEEYDVKVEETEDGKVLVHHGNDIYEVETEHDKAQALFNRQSQNELEGAADNVITAPLPGIITDVKVKPGDTVEEGQALVKLIAMKMENEITSKISGKVKEVKIKKDDNVNKGDVLVLLE